MKLNRSLLLIVLLALLATGALAQDTPWKGAYLGGYAGAGIGGSDARLTTIFSPTGYFATTSPPAIAALSPQHPDSTNFIGGVQAGYNHQYKTVPVVLGIEADFGSLHRSESRTGTGTYPCCAPTGFTVTQTVSAGWLATVRPRLGYAHGKALVYATAGLAVSDFGYRGVFTDTFATASESGRSTNNKLGWTVGGGLEYIFHPHWSLKGEYLYADFAGSSGGAHVRSTNLTAFSPPIPFPTNVFTHKADLRLNMVRFGMNYHF